MSEIVYGETGGLTGTLIDNMSSRMKVLAGINQTGVQSVYYSLNVASIVDNGAGKTIIKPTILFVTPVKASYTADTTNGWYAFATYSATDAYSGDLFSSADASGGAPGDTDGMVYGASGTEARLDQT